MTRLISLARTLLNQGTSTANRSYLISRMASGYLVDNSKFSFLKDLGLEKCNNGVYNGEWSGSGPVCTSEKIQNLNFNSIEYCS